MIYYRIDLPGGVSTSILIDFVKENQPKSRSISPKIEKWRSAGVPAVLCTLVFLRPNSRNSMWQSCLRSQNRVAHWNKREKLRVRVNFRFARVAFFDGRNREKWSADPPFHPGCTGVQGGDSEPKGGRSPPLFFESPFFRAVLRSGLAQEKN